ncbi:MAG: crossover junction endodeoxyribonuclease RuvC [Candidatus Omnitrophica bacterium]|nr:crossover junction endodeoxyribonuclease RuvC [Candidatus Omnitrophota bacterium]
MKILGVDPGLYISGYGLVDWNNREPILIEAGIVKTRKDDKVERRLQYIYRSMLSLVNRMKPQAIALEKLYSHHRHPTTSYALGQARGLICLISAQLNIPLYEYPSTRIKKAVIGRGRASKEQLQKVIQQFLKIKDTPKYFDITDALAVAITHGHTLKGLG